MTAVPLLAHSLLDWVLLQYQCSTTRGRIGPPRSSKNVGQCRFTPCLLKCLH
uniref:Uncharacterized protein n=1 Tax=Anguilla anguilla TaxID=7936 RepID=A0A0E9PEH4_ANGAN